MHNLCAIDSTFFFVHGVGHLCGTIAELILYDQNFAAEKNK